MLTPSLAVAPLPRRLAALVNVILALAAVSCGGAGKGGGDTHVAREEAFHTGNVDYDDFFEDVNALRTNGKKAVADEKSARAPLAQALGVGTDAPLDKLLDAFRAKSEELARSKGRIHIFFFGIDKQGHPIPGKKITVVAISGANLEVTKETSQFTAATEQTTQKEAQVLDEFGILPDKGRRLEGKVAGMRSSVDTEFPHLSKDKRRQIDDELKAAGQLSGQIAEECGKVVSDSGRFLKEAPDIVVAAATIDVKPAKGSKGKGTKPPPPPPDHGSAPPERAAEPPPSAPPAKSARSSSPPPKPAPATKEPPASAAAAPAAPAPKPASPPPKKKAPPPPAEPAPKPADFNP